MLLYELYWKTFAKCPGTIFNLPDVNKFLMSFITEQDTDGKNIFKFQDIKLDYFDYATDSLAFSRPYQSQYQLTRNSTCCK